MSNPPSSNCQWLLTDRALTPILSTAPIPSPGETKPSRQAQAQLQSLTSLTTTAITAFESASRLGLGIPQRIIVETRSSGPVILHSYLNPPSQQRQTTPAHENADERGIIERARDELRPLTATTEGGSEGHNEIGIQANGIASAPFLAPEEAVDEENESNLQRSPLLIASVIAPNLGDARKAAGALERTGREIQRELAMEQQQEGSQDIVHGGEDG